MAYYIQYSRPCGTVIAFILLMIRSHQGTQTVHHRYPDILPSTMHPSVNNSNEIIFPEHWLKFKAIRKDRFGAANST